MKNKFFFDNTLALVCARGGSKGLKNKNLALWNKKPLIYYAIKKIIKNKLKYNCISSDNKSFFCKIKKTFKIPRF